MNIMTNTTTADTSSEIEFLTERRAKLKIRQNTMLVKRNRERIDPGNQASHIQERDERDEHDSSRQLLISVAR